jgi:hypothetical protein
MGIPGNTYLSQAFGTEFIAAVVNYVQPNE